MSAPKGKDGRRLGGAALEAYRRKRGRGGGKRRRPSGSTAMTTTRRRPSGSSGGGSGSNAPGVMEVIGATGSLAVGSGLPVLVSALAARFGPAWMRHIATTTGLRALVTMLIGAGFWFGSSTQRAKLAYAGPAIAGGTIATLKPGAAALYAYIQAQRDRPQGAYVSERQRQTRARPSGRYLAEAQRAGAGGRRRRYANA